MYRTYNPHTELKAIPSGWSSLDWFYLREDWSVHPKTQAGAAITDNRPVSPLGFCCMYTCLFRQDLLVPWVTWLITNYIFLSHINHMCV